MGRREIGIVGGIAAALVAAVLATVLLVSDDETVEAADPVGLVDWDELAGRFTAQNCRAEVAEDRLGMSVELGDPCRTLLVDTMLSMSIVPPESLDEIAAVSPFRGEHADIWVEPTAEIGVYEARFEERGPDDP